jgi:hypothetical protein
MVSNGPMNDQRSARPSRIPRSTSSAEPEGLLEERALQPVHDETIQLAPHHQRRMACIAQEGTGALDDFRRCPGAGTISAAGTRYGG